MLIELSDQLLRIYIKRVDRCLCNDPTWAFFAQENDWHADKPIRSDNRDLYRSAIFSDSKQRGHTAAKEISITHWLADFVENALSGEVNWFEVLEKLIAFVIGEGGQQTVFDLYRSIGDHLATTNARLTHDP